MDRVRGDGRDLPTHRRRPVHVLRDQPAPLDPAARGGLAGDAAPGDRYQPAIDHSAAADQADAALWRFPGRVQHRRRDQTRAAGDCRRPVPHRQQHRPIAIVLDHAGRALCAGRNRHVPTHPHLRMARLGGDRGRALRPHDRHPPQPSHEPRSAAARQGRGFVSDQPRSGGGDLFHRLRDGCFHRGLDRSD